MNKHKIPLIILALIAIITYVLWRWDSPYPYTLNWDIWEHQTIINSILRGNDGLFPSQLSDTFRFDGYTTLFHYILAIPQFLITQVTGIHDILGFWWISEGLFLIATTIASYFFTYALTKRTLLALIGGMLSVFFFEFSISFASFFLIPQTVCALIWTGVIIYVLTVQRQSFWLLFLLSLILIALHGIIGTFGVLLVFLYIFIKRFADNTLLYIILVLTLPVSTYFGLSFIGQIPSITSINHGEALYFAQTALQKLEIMRGWYSIIPLLFLPFGILMVEDQRDKRNGRTMVILYLVVMVITLSTFPYALKFYTIGRYITVALIAWGIGWFLHHLKSNGAKIFSILCLLVTGVVIFWTNSRVWKSSLLFRGVASQLSYNERVASQFLIKNYSNVNALLVSDPATQYIFEALTDINSPGGAYANNNTRAVFSRLMAENSDDKLLPLLSSINDPVVQTKPNIYLLIASARYFQWLKSPDEKRNSITYNIWRPDALSLRDYILLSDWKNRMNLTELYKNNSLVIFEIKNP